MINAKLDKNHDSYCVKQQRVKVLNINGTDDLCVNGRKSHGFAFLPKQIANTT